MTLEWKGWFFLIFPNIGRNPERSYTGANHDALNLNYVALTVREPNRRGSGARRKTLNRNQRRLT